MTTIDTLALALKQKKRAIIINQVVPGIACVAYRSQWWGSGVLGLAQADSLANTDLQLLFYAFSQYTLQLYSSGRLTQMAGVFSVLGLVYDRPVPEEAKKLQPTLKMGLVSRRALIYRLGHQKAGVEQMVTWILDAPNARVHPNSFPPLPITLFPGPSFLKRELRRAHESM